MANQLHTQPSGPCIWMQAGVVSKKMCRRTYDCNGCRYDRALRQLAEKNRKRITSESAVSGRRGRIVYWADKLKERPTHRRHCIHHMKKRISFRSCTNDYLCSNCEFDQYFQDQYMVHAILKPVGMEDVQGVKIPQGVYLHKGHTWVGMASGGQVRIGLDAFAARLLGPMESIDLPLMGKPVQRNRGDIRMRRGDLNADLLSPVSGVVTAFNPDVRAHPETPSADPYGNGWMLMVQPTNLRDDLRSLQMGEEATTFMKSEVDYLYQELETELGPMATDGGNLTDDIFGKLPPACWNRIANKFLKN